MLTDQQREIAELLKSLNRPAAMIAVNTGLPVEIVESWLKSGKWPKSTTRQKTLFDATGLSPRPSRTQPATASKGNHGLSLFAKSPGGNPVSTNNHSSPEQLNDIA